MSLARKDGMVPMSFSQPLQSPHASSYHKGDEVFLAKGSYQGTVGTFLNLRGDPRWADILERNSQVLAHPVEWLQHASRD
jgi:hypothetical protein